MWINLHDIIAGRNFNAFIQHEIPMLWRFASQPFTNRHLWILLEDSYTTGLFQAKYPGAGDRVISNKSILYFFHLYANSIFSLMCFQCMRQSTSTSICCVGNKFPGVLAGHFLKDLACSIFCGCCTLQNWKWSMANPGTLPWQPWK